MYNNLPILHHLWEVLEEHIILLEDLKTGLVKAPWLVDMFQQVEELYRKHGTI